MGLKSGFVDWVEESFPGAIKNEPADSGPGIIASTNAVVIELNILAHQIPAFVDSGNKLWRWFENMYCPSVAHFKRSLLDHESIGPLSKFLVFVADNYERVPHQKRATQHARHVASSAALTKSGGTKEELDALVVTDDFCPSAVQINASSALIFKVIVYLIGRLSIAHSREDRFSVYVSCPSRKGAADGEHVPVLACSYVSGQNIRLSAHGNEPPPPFVLGEGEIAAWVWSDILKKWGATRILIKSIDNDNIGIALAVPKRYTTNVFIQLKSREYDKPSKKDPKRLCMQGTKTARFFDCGFFINALGGTDDKHNILFSAIIAGSDFCIPLRPSDASPIPGVSIGTILKVLAVTKEPLCRTAPDGTVSVDIPAANRFIIECIRIRRRVTICGDELAAFRPVIESAAWNINYWASIFTMK